MKKFIAVFVILIVLITFWPINFWDRNVNSPNANYVPLEQLPEDYSLENAKADKCVVYENGDITHGQSIWNGFTTQARKGNAVTVRLAYYYTLDDSSHYSKEYYESIKDDYPVLYVKDLSFDGNKYRLEGFEDSKLYEKEYNYMMKYEGEPRSPSAVFSKYTRYVLVNDNTATWEDIEDGAVSSQSGAYIDNYPVYTDLIWK